MDASALAALAFNEPHGEEIATALDGALVHAPTLLAYEMANVAWKKARRNAAQAPAIVRVVEAVLDDRGITWCSVPAADVALVSLATGLSAYDAAYVWLAGFLGADLVTLDDRIVRQCGAS